MNGKERSGFRGCGTSPARTETTPRHFCPAAQWFVGGVKAPPYVDNTVTVLSNYRQSSTNFQNLIRIVEKDWLTGRGTVPRTAYH